MAVSTARRTAATNDRSASARTAGVGLASPCGVAARGRRRRLSGPHRSGRGRWRGWPNSIVPMPLPSPSRTSTPSPAAPSRSMSPTSKTRWWPDGGAGTASSTTCSSWPPSGHSTWARWRPCWPGCGWDPTAVPGRSTHLLLRVVDGSGPWIADVGFGGGGLLEPVPLATGDRIRAVGLALPAGGGRRRARPADLPGRRLVGHVRLRTGTRPTVDIKVSNWFTATHPDVRPS